MQIDKIKSLMSMKQILAALEPIDEEGYFTFYYKAKTKFAEEHLEELAEILKTCPFPLDKKIIDHVQMMKTVGTASINDIECLVKDGKKSIFIPDPMNWMLLDAGLLKA